MRRARMMECTDIFWHHFYTGAGAMLGGVLPMLLGFGTLMWAIFQLQHRHKVAGQETRRRHEEALQEARTRADQVRDSRYRVIQGGQG
jgi:hypothetical protein